MHDYLEIPVSANKRQRTDENNSEYQQQDHSRQIGEAGQQTDVDAAQGEQSLGVQPTRVLQNRCKITAYNTNVEETMWNKLVSWHWQSCSSLKIKLRLCLILEELAAYPDLRNERTHVE